MNILYTNFHVAGGGGHDVYIRTLLKQDTHTIYVACPESSNLYQSLKRDNEANILPLEFPGKLSDGVNIIIQLRRLLAIIQDYEIDIVHTNGSSDNRLVTYARLFSRRKFKQIFTKHNAFPIRGLISQWRFMKANHAIIFVSQSIYQSIGFPVRSDKITVIRNGVDTDYWQMPTTIVSSEQIRLVSIAGTSRYKGWHYLINALKLLPEPVRCRFTVTIAGDLPDIATRLERCRGDWLPEQVTFTGFTPEPYSILLNGDIGFVLSDAVETISFACREMMSAGLPVIVSNFGGLSENIESGQDGWIIPVGDEVALAKLLTDIHMMDPLALTKMKQHARAKAQLEFGVENMILETQRVYDAVMSNEAINSNQ
ncbi:glycosyltransferase family 4 protein [Budvicia aquatica]|uniref:Glycosyltransferase family 1 protein n=2 Tax=Budvicia aquatica TaxID=82979 RepID=A0A2C6CX79_9GAMM|nr:glycosyltransferase family 4 protein [Budvicia aquatica]PHI31289.1 glycosyltransferase family 1 protein [Budvicia aquatica]